MIRPLSFSTTENTSQFHFGKSLSSSLLFSRHQRRKNKNKKQTGRIIYIYIERERDIYALICFFFFLLCCLFMIHVFFHPLYCHISLLHIYLFVFSFSFVFKTTNLSHGERQGGRERDESVCLGTWQCFVDPMQVRGSKERVFEFC